MAKHVLVAIDGSTQAWKALDHALEEFAGERITVLTVVDPAEGVYADVEGGYYMAEAFEDAVESGEDLCEEARERAADAGILETTEFDTAVEIGRPIREIVEYAEDHDVDHIVVGSHGRSGASRILFGSVAESVTRRAHVPVTIVR